LEAYWQQNRANNPNTLLLTGGDAVGASRPLAHPQFRELVDGPGPYAGRRWVSGGPPTI